MKNDYYAHSGDKSDFSDWQPLRDHLHEVAKLARHFAEAACPNDPALADAAFAAGLLHDLGKYRVEFQQMIRKIPVQQEKTWHKQAGAATAAFANAVSSAFAIAGHHGGIPNKADLIPSVKGESGKAVADAAYRGHEQGFVQVQSTPVVSMRSRSRSPSCDHSHSVACTPLRQNCLSGLAARNAVASSSRFSRRRSFFRFCLATCRSQPACYR